MYQKQHFKDGKALTAAQMNHIEDGIVQALNVLDAAAMIVNVKYFGAVGDGNVDDTDAIRKARDAAVASNKSLYFPKGTYIVHGSIELWSDCEIYGEGSKSIIKKVPAITMKAHKPSGGFITNQTTFTVDDASMYTIGYEACVCLDMANYELIVLGEITEITGNNITIAPHPSAELTDGVKDSFNSATHSNRTLFSSSFPVFRTPSYRYAGGVNYDSVHDVYIHDLVIDGNRQSEEPHVYLLSAVHFGSRPFPTPNNSDDYRLISDPHENIRLENLNICNSPSDGISVQSSKNVYITNCITENCGFNGVHFGVGTDIASVVGCKLNANYCGYFDCADVGSVSLTGNHFEKCRYGVGGIDQYTNGLTITGNTFRECSVGVCAGLLPFPDYMSHLNTSSYMFGHISQAASAVSISNNAFYGITETIGSTVTRTGIGISAIGGTSFVFSGNTFRNLDCAFEIGCSKYIRIANNFIRDCNAALSMVDGSTVIQQACGTLTIDSAFTDNTIQAKAAGASACITIRRARNMFVVGNVLIGTDAGVVTGDDTENVAIDNNIGNGNIVTLGDISTALDRIIELQEELIGV